MKLKLQSYSITCLSSIYFHELEQPRSKNQDSVGFRSSFVDFNSLFAPSFKKARTIAPLYTGGPVAITQNGLWLITCVGEEALLTDLQSGAEICRFAGVLYHP